MGNSGVFPNRRFPVIISFGKRATVTPPEFFRSFPFPYLPGNGPGIPHHATDSRKASGTRFHASRPAPPPAGEKQHPATERNGQIWHHRLQVSNLQVFKSSNHQVFKSSSLQISNRQIFHHQIVKSPRFRFHRITATVNQASMKARKHSIRTDCARWGDPFPKVRPDRGDSRLRRRVNTRTTA